MNFLHCVIEFDCDPFDPEKPQLRFLQSGAVASEELIKDFETALEDGETSVEQFFNGRLFSGTIPFDAIMHRKSRRSFSNPPVAPDASSHTTMTKIDAMENKAMASVMWLAETGEEKFTLAEVMEYRVTDECLPIFNINGTMKKVYKSKMIEKLHTEPMKAFPDKYIG